MGVRETLQPITEPRPSLFEGCELPENLQPGGIPESVLGITSGPLLQEEPQSGSGFAEAIRDARLHYGDFIRHQVELHCGAGGLKASGLAGPNRLGQLSHCSASSAARTWI